MSKFNQQIFENQVAEKSSKRSVKDNSGLYPALWRACQEELYQVYLLGLLAVSQEE